MRASCYLSTRWFHLLILSLICHTNSEAVAGCLRPLRGSGGHFQRNAAHPAGRRKKGGPHLAAAFHARAVTRICQTSGTFRYGHTALREGPSKFITLGKMLEHMASTVMRGISNVSSHASSAGAQLHLSAFAFGRSGELAPNEKSCMCEKFPAVGMRVRVRHPPAKEEEAGQVIRTSMSVSRWRSVGTWAAGNSVDQALTRRSTADTHAFINVCTLKTLFMLCHVFQ